MVPTIPKPGISPGVPFDAWFFHSADTPTATPTGKSPLYQLQVMGPGDTYLAQYATPTTGFWGDPCSL